MRAGMSFLLFPGRHLVNTKFQEQYLKRVLAKPPASLPGFLAGASSLPKPPTEIIFAITSANQENSRFNPIPFPLRSQDQFRFELMQRQFKTGRVLVGIYESDLHRVIYLQL